MFNKCPVFFLVEIKSWILIVSVFLTDFLKKDENVSC